MQDRPDPPDPSTFGTVSDQGAELLRGAIARVEKLVARLDYPGVSSFDSDTQQAGMEPAAGPRRTGLEADSLRISLNARDEADRTLAEAAQFRADAAAEGQRMLADAQQLAAEVEAEATAHAERVRAEAEASANRLREEAQRAMRATIADVTSAANEVRSAAEEEAEQLRVEAAAWATATRAEGESVVTLAREQAEQEAEQIRRVAEEHGRAEAARHAEEQVQEAVARARADAGAEHDRLRELHGQVMANLAVAREAIRDVGHAMSGSLAVLTDASHALDELLGADEQPTSDERTPRETSDAESVGAAEQGRADAGDPGAQPVAPSAGEPEAAVRSDAADAGAPEEPRTEPPADAADQPASPISPGPDVSNEGGKQRRPLGALFRRDRS